MEDRCDGCRRPFAWCRCGAVVIDRDPQMRLALAIAGRTESTDG